MASHPKHKTRKGLAHLAFATPTLTLDLTITKRGKLHMADSTTTAAKTETQDRSANVYVGVALEINNRTVELAPTTPINKIDEVGLELELPENLYLGKLQAGIDALVGQFSPGFKFDECKEKAKDIPALQKFIAKVGDAEITIQDLHIKIPPKLKATEADKLKDPTKSTAEGSVKPSDPATLYTVALAATWPKTGDEKKKKEKEESLGGFDITLRGIYVMVTNETREEIDMRRARAKAIQKKAQDAMLLEAAFSNSAASEVTPAAVDKGGKGQTKPKTGDAEKPEKPETVVAG